MDHREARRNELSYEEHCRILDEITAAGCLWLLYTGGEIFARSDFLDIYSHAKRNGLLVTLFTNATLITPAIADRLLDLRPFAIEVSLYGRTSQTHERITGVPGSYEHCLRGIRLLAERGLPLTIKTMAISLNKHEIREMQQFVKTELGLEFKFDTMINPRIDCSQDPLAVRMRPEEIVALDLQYPERISEWKRFCEHCHGPVHDPKRKDALFDCGAGVHAFAIDPSGRLSNCLLWSVDTYDLREGSFQEGWEKFLGTVLDKKATRQTKCRACDIKNMCGMCPVNGQLECLDPETPVDFLCRVAHLRAYALGLSVSPHGKCAYCEGGREYETIMETVAALRGERVE
jgi:radical SAM protein with 4Fe4S-binding SPASM domain